MSQRTVTRLAGAFGLMAVCAVLLAACGGSGGSTSSEASSDENHKPVSLTLGWWYNDTMEGFAKLIDGFEEKYPWITVNQDSPPYEEYYQKLGAWTSSGSGPDVIAVEAGKLWEPYKDDLQPLGKWGEELSQEVFDPRQFCPELDCSKGVYGVPFTRWFPLLYFNRPIIEAAGLDPDDPPTTVSEMDAACKKVAEIDKACWVVGGKDIGLWLIATEMALNTASEEQLTALGEGKASWKDPEFKGLLETMQYMGDQDWFQEGFTSLPMGAGQESFMAGGRAAFVLGAAGDGLTWKDYGKLLGPENVGALNLPFLDEGALPGVEPGPLNGTLGVPMGTALAVPKWSKHPEEAKLLAAYTLEESVQKSLVGVPSPPFPSIKAVEASWSPEPAFGEVLALADTSKGPDLIQGYIGYGYIETLTSELQQLSLGETTPDAAAAALDKAAHAALTSE
jgi:raffinose/stachyose/melibiose transport system substrate-binding protein